jgi:hypothetical protein
VNEHVQLLLDSFAWLLGRELIPRTGSAAEQAERLFQAPFVVVSHGTQADPILNYGNAAALALWEMTAEELRRTGESATEKRAYSISQILRIKFAVLVNQLVFLGADSAGMANLR